jgi:hypothetical protein
MFRMLALYLEGPVACTQDQARLQELAGKTLADLRRSYEKNAAFSNRYVSENGLK